MVKYFTQDEMRKLLRAIENKRDRALFLIAYRHGLRAGEVPILRRSDIDLSRRKITIKRLKSGLGGEQLMAEDEIKAIRSYLRTRTDSDEVLFRSRNKNPIAPRTLDYLMKKYCGEAGIPKEKAHFHSLRHSIAVHLLDSGADVLFVRDILGHKNIQNTLIYAQITSVRRDEIHRGLLESDRIV
jgi:site-specific recombinase XerD